MPPTSFSSMVDHYGAAWKEQAHINSC
jgi:hypothetical protein